MDAYPIDDLLPLICDTVRTRSSAVIHAAPGAGKTTRVPMALLDVIPPDRGRILIVEPRRLAAVSAARWMARGLGEDVGGTIGYTIRFNQKVSRATRVEVVTEGILTRRIQVDPSLKGVALVIFDEFHERSLGSDLALALCLDMRSGLREDLGIMVMSATLDCGPVASLLDGAPILSSPGKAYPVEERYLGEIPGMSLPEKIASAVQKALGESSGDILVFLPGAAEIRSCANAVRRTIDAGRSGIAVHELYGELSFAQQEKAILPSKSRKIVCATNIAETGLTIEGVGIVIDSGLTRRLQYDPRTGMNRLVTATVSMASAEQRRGRAGRLGPGVCYRLYSRYQFEGMIPFAPPEMMTTDLSALVLELAAWGVRNPARLSWLDLPPIASWDAATGLLRDLGALDKDSRITPLGEDMVRLPLHPRLARMVVSAGKRGYAALGADLAAILAERDMLGRSDRRDSPAIRDQEVATRLELLRLWRSGGIPSMGDSWSLRAVDRAANQISRLMGKHAREWREGESEDDVTSRLLLEAFPDRVGKRRERDRGRYLLSQGRGARLQGNSSLVDTEYLVAVDVDAGEHGEGMIHLAAPVDVAIIRQECAGRIVTSRSVEWREGRVAAVIEECLGEITLSSRPFPPSDEEAVPCICDAIRSQPGMLFFSPAVRQFLGRITLMARTFPEEEWPDLAEGSLASRPESWLIPWLAGVRSAKDLNAMDLLPPLKALLTRKQLLILERRAPAQLTVPSGNRIWLNYAKGEVPVLAVKVQEMFGLADTPSVAEGRVKVLLHLLSPAGRPVQITADLTHFWNNVYPQARKELRGRYPKHPWPDDPWSAEATRGTRQRTRLS